MSEFEKMYESSKELTSGLGGTVWTVLEALKRGKAPAEDVKKVEDLCNTYFAQLTDDDCNNLCRVLEKRLSDDKGSDDQWYSQFKQFAPTSPTPSKGTAP